MKGQESRSLVALGVGAIALLAFALIGVGRAQQAPLARLLPPTATPPTAQPSPVTPPPPAPVQEKAIEVPPPLTLPPQAQAEPHDRTLPINLATAMRLAGAQPLDIALAATRVQIAAAQLTRANVLWLPTVYLGADYARHDGQLQDVVGQVFNTNKSSLLIGAGPSAVFALTDAIFAPLAARRIVAAREAEVQAARNDSLLAVAEAYFNVQQARGELAAAVDTVRRAADLVAKAEGLAEGLAQPFEADRARAELAARRQAVQLAHERWRVASAELNRLLRLTPGTLVEPLEPPHLTVSLFDANLSVDELIPLALTYRPELAAQQELVQATLARLPQERIRPLIPSVLLRGNGTNPAGTLSSGYFGGGLNDFVGNFSGRNSMDVQLLWEIQNLGLGNLAAVKERSAENQLARLELLRFQDRVAAEVDQAHAQTVRAAGRLPLAEEGVQNAVLTAEKNIEGLKARRVGDVFVLIVRPQEAVAAVQALAQAYANYYGAVADVNRAQFRLYRALGQPAQCLLPPVEPEGKGAQRR